MFLVTIPKCKTKALNICPFLPLSSSVNWNTSIEHLHRCACQANSVPKTRKGKTIWTRSRTQFTLERREKSLWGWVGRSMRCDVTQSSTLLAQPTQEKFPTVEFSPDFPNTADLVSNQWSLRITDFLWQENSLAGLHRWKGSWELVPHLCQLILPWSQKAQGSSTKALEIWLPETSVIIMLFNNFFPQVLKSCNLTHKKTDKASGAPSIQWRSTWDLSILLW